MEPQRVHDAIFSLPSVECRKVLEKKFSDLLDAANKKKEELKQIHADIEELEELLQQWSEQKNNYEAEETKRAEDVRQGKIYGEDYHRYSLEDIVKITDLNFLVDMYYAVTPSGQPTNSDDWDRLTNLLDAINRRIRELENA